MMCLADLIGFFFGILGCLSSILIWKNYRNQLPWWNSQRCLAHHCVVIEPMIIWIKIFFCSDPDRAYQQLLDEINLLEREPQWVPAAWLRKEQTHSFYWATPLSVKLLHLKEPLFFTLELPQLSSSTKQPLSSSAIPIPSSPSVSKSASILRKKAAHGDFPALNTSSSRSRALPTSPKRTSTTSPIPPHKNQLWILALWSFLPSSWLPEIRIQN